MTKSEQRKTDLFAALREALGHPVQLAVVLVVVTGLLLLMFRAGELVDVAANSSLGGDEITSVRMFSGQGLKTTLSDYRIPNNHVFFNALNSILPGSGSFEPVRARIVSLVATGVGLLLGLMACIRRRTWLLLAAFSIAYLGDDRLLLLHVSARGYGLLAMAAALVCVLVWWQLEPAVTIGKGKNAEAVPATWVLPALGVSVVVGALSVPTFLFFGGSVLLAMFLRRPARRTFFTGAVVFVVVVGFFGWLYISNHGLKPAPAGFFEGEFHELQAVLMPVQLFALEGWPNAIRFVVVLFVLSAPWMALRGSGRRNTLWCLWWKVVGSLLICLVMKRPLMHTVAHLMVPGAFLVGLGAEALWQRCPQTPRRWQIAGGVLALLLPASMLISSFRPRDPLSFWPLESWKEIADTTSAIAPGRAVFAPFRGNHLEVYLAEENPLAEDYDAEKFQSGEQIVVSSPVTKYPGEEVAPGIMESAQVKLSIRQRAYSFQQLAWNPPVGVRAEILSAGLKPGTTSGKTFSLQLQLPAERQAGNILFVYSTTPIMSKPPSVRAATPEGGGRKLKVQAVGPMWAVVLPADLNSDALLEVNYYSSEAGDLPPGFVAWIGAGIPAAEVASLLYF